MKQQLPPFMEMMILFAAILIGLALIFGVN